MRRSQLLSLTTMDSFILGNNRALRHLPYRPLQVVHFNGDIAKNPDLAGQALVGIGFHSLQKIGLGRSRRTQPLGTAKDPDVTNSAVSLAAVKFQTSRMLCAHALKSKPLAHWKFTNITFVMNGQNDIHRSPT